MACMTSSKVSSVRPTEGRRARPRRVLPRRVRPTEGRRARPTTAARFPQAPTGIVVLKRNVRIQQSVSAERRREPFLYPFLDRRGVVVVENTWLFPFRPYCFSDPNAPPYKNTRACGNSQNLRCLERVYGRTKQAETSEWSHARTLYFLISTAQHVNVA